MKPYFRPIIQDDATRSPDAIPLAGGGLWFDRVERIDRNSTQLIPACDLPDAILHNLRTPRPAVAGLDMGQPQLMGVLNLTPDSFSDGGRFNSVQSALDHAREMVVQGATILDLGGESTRPGADFVSVDTEIKRTVPVIKALRDAGITTPISIDTRKAAVAQAALDAGANMVNDVSALSFDADMAQVLAESDVPVCLMHAQGDPATMQDDPVYENVLLDVYDYLEMQVDFAVRSGISRDRIIIDPGIGFGKTQDHNLALIRGLGLFHGLGCLILLGVSRKRFIGAIGGAAQADQRGPGSVAVGLYGISQGVQILRAHDIETHRQAIALWQAVSGQI